MRSRQFAANITLLLSLASFVQLAPYLMTSKSLAQTPITQQQRASLRGKAEGLYVQGDELLRQGQLPKALQNFQQVLQIRQQLGDKPGEAESLIKIGDTYSQQKQIEQARNSYEQALTIYKEISDRNGELNARIKLSALPSNPSVTTQNAPINPPANVPDRNLLRDDDRTQPDRPATTPDRTVLRDDDKNNPIELPWVIVSKNRNQAVPLPVSNKISTFFLSKGLSPVSCSTQPVVIMTVNNIYVACASPTSNFPPGNYNATIPDL